MPNDLPPRDENVEIEAVFALLFDEIHSGNFCNECEITEGDDLITCARVDRIMAALHLAPPENATHQHADSIPGARFAHESHAPAPLDPDRPRLDSRETVEWWLANNYGPHVNTRAWQWIRELRAEIARLQALVDERHPA